METRSKSKTAEMGDTGAQGENSIPVTDHTDAGASGTTSKTPRSRIGSVKSLSILQASHSSKVMNQQLECDLEEERSELEASERSIALNMWKMDEEIKGLEDDLAELREKLEDITSWDDEDSEQNIKRDIKQLEKALKGMNKKRYIQQAENDNEMINISNKKKLLSIKASLEKNKIDEIFDQVLSDEDDDHHTSVTVLPNTQNEAGPLHGVGVQPHEDELQRVEAEKQIVLQQLEDQKAMAERVKVQCEVMNLKAAEEVQKQLQLEDKLNDLTQIEKSSVVGAAASNVSGEERLIQMFAQAIGRVNRPPEPSSNQKFLARQSHAKDLPFFSGRPQEWLTFKSAYQRTTRICAFENDENLNRLHKCLKGDALETVRSLMDNPENVKAIMDKLEMRFGQPEFIIKAMTQRVKEVPPIKDNQLETIIEFGNAVDGLTRTLQSLGRTDHLQNPMLLEELESKLTIIYRMTWREWLESNPSKSKDVVSFSEWLEKKTKLACALCPPTTCSPKQDKVKVNPGNCEKRQHWDNRNPNRRRPGEHAMAMDGDLEKKEYPAAKDRKCGCCTKTGHRLQMCDEFKALDGSARNRFVKDKRLCYSCLNYGHLTKDCRNKKKCGTDGCTGTHHFLLHMDNQKMKSKEKNEDVNLAEEDEDIRVENVEYAFENDMREDGGHPSSKLRILPVKLKGPNGYIEKFAMLDPGASVTLITESLAEELQLKGRPITLVLKGINKSEPKTGSREVSFAVFDRNGKGPFNIKNACTTQKLPLPAQTQSPQLLKKWKHLKGLDLAAFENGVPDLLIGQDHGDLIASREIREGPFKSPVAIKTLLGWTLSGIRSQLVRRESNFHISRELGEEQRQLQELHQIVKRHMNIDDIGIKTVPVQTRSKEDILSQKQMDRDVKKIEGSISKSGHVWEAGLLRKPDDVKRPDGYFQARSRLESMERKMDRNPEFAQKYEDKIQEYVSKGFARKLTEAESAEDGNWTYYIPHFMAFNPKKEKPYRFVFDCAAKINGVSFNDRLMTGPDKLVPLIDILYALRERKFAVSGDIMDMFHRVRIKKEDASFQRFLFRGMDRSRDPDKYQMDVLIFGASCSPTLAQEAKNKNAALYAKEYPDAARAIVKNFYVDDYGQSFDTAGEAIKSQQEITTICQAGGFLVHKWRTNSEEVLKAIPERLRAESKTIKSLDCSQDSEAERILGLFWRPQEDHFTFALNFLKVNKEVFDGIRKPTKRETLALVMSIYDPLGLLSPFRIKAKMILQDTWRMKTDWNEELPMMVHGKWETWLEEMKQIHTFRIPRCYSEDLSTADEVQLHIFGDASEQAYGAVAYFRIRKDGIISTALINAKAKVAPLKPISIPRSELQAALIGSRLAKSIKESHSVKIHRTVYWTDSEVVSAWTKSDGKRYPQFIANRVGEIQENTDTSEWRWLPGKENVADELTRDKMPCDWSSKSRWVNGPAFLKLNEDMWPKEKAPKAKEESLELKKEHILLVTKSKVTLFDINRYSSWIRLLRTTAFVQRFVRRCRNPTDRQKGVSWELTPTELKSSEEWLWKQAQAESFEDDVNFLSNQKGKDYPCVDKSSQLKKLSPFLDPAGILRVSEWNWNNELMDALEQLNHNKMTEECAAQNINWVFNPPAAPHMGGVWERLVRSVKVALYSILKDHSPREEVLQTLLVEAEEMVNNHPLIDVSFDIDDLEAITPNHILKPYNKIGRTLGEGDMNSRDLWRRTEDLADQFWGRWRKEYLPTLLMRQKWHKSGKPIKIGDIVLIVDKSMPRGSWPLGKIVRVFPGSDGLVRVAEVQTAKRIYRRPVARLAALDVLGDNQDKEKIAAVITRAGQKKKDGENPAEKEVRTMPTTCVVKVSYRLPTAMAKQLGILSIQQELTLLKKTGWYSKTLIDYRKTFQARKKKTEVKVIQ